MILAAIAILALTSPRVADPLPGTVWGQAQLTAPNGAPKTWTPGRVTVISFYAFWCDTWKVQEPQLERAHAGLKGLPIDFLTISIDGRWKEVEKGKASLPLLVDGDGSWSRSIGVNRVPTTVVVDGTGRVRWVRSGTVKAETVVAQAQRALKPVIDGGPIYLTFDDFPPQEGGDDLLDKLRELGVRATFFCICSRVEECADLLKRALAEGHELDCHSWDHRAAQPQLDKCREVFKRVLGLDHFLYRAPGSDKIDGVDLPNLNTFDYTRPGEAEVERRVLLGARRNVVLQMHAGVADTLAALPAIVGQLQARGFAFRTVAERRRSR